MKTTRNLLVAALIASLTSLVPGTAHASILPAGSLDPSFGTGGVGEEVSQYRESYWANAVVTQADGRIMVLARETGRRSYDLIRFNSDGTVDRTFGREGVARTLSWSGEGKTPGAIATQVDDDMSKTLVEVDGSILRYDGSGILDASFGNGGKAVGPLTGAAVPRDIELSPSGDRIYALADPGKMGVSIAYSGYQAMPQAVEALTADGNVDESFGTDGAAMIGAPILNPTGFKDLTVLPDGRIVISGGWLTARLLPNGDLDETFGDHGFVIDDADDNRWNQRVQVDGQGRILVMRCYHANSQVWGELNWDCKMVRYLPDGERDTSYGEGGVAPLTSGDSSGFEIDDKGRAVVFGVFDDEDKYTVLRLTPDGQPDASFGEAGLVMTHSLGGGDVFAGAGTVQQDGKPLLVANFSDQTEWEKELKIWRYLAEAQSTSDPGPGSDPSLASLSGRVLDGKSGTGLAGAIVDCGTGTVATTDSSGAYAMSVPTGAHTCTASLAGYRTGKARIDVTSTGATYDFKLR